jgi:hypothetical protein
MSGPPPEILANTKSWEEKLKGKNVSSTDVCPSTAQRALQERGGWLRGNVRLTNGHRFWGTQVKSQLPPKHRVIAPGTMVTRDFVEDRLNVHVDEKGVCTHCTHG